MGAQTREVIGFRGDSVGRSDSLSLSLTFYSPYHLISQIRLQCARETLGDQTSPSIGCENPLYLSQQGKSCSPSRRCVDIQFAAECRFWCERKLDHVRPPTEEDGEGADRRREDSSRKRARIRARRRRMPRMPEWQCVTQLAMSCT